MAGRTIAEVSAPGSLSAFQSNIEADTVVLDYFIGADPADAPALFVLAMTSDTAALCIGPLVVPDEAADPVGRLVQDIRTGIPQLPGFSGIVSRAGEAALLAGARAVLGPVASFLKEQQARGRTHLVIVPHGPLHFMPMHLLGAANAPLADDWTVTYLPVAALAAPHAEQPAPDRRAKLTAIGLDFRDERHMGWTPIDEAPRFADALASALQGTALVNAAATEVAVKSALQSSRYVHVTTHGAQCAYAAAFHALFLAPDPAHGDDGILRSYEVLSLRCQGLEVLTLSACESALGRFDSGDNLTGLPGSLFLAGAQRIIGTLWRVALAVANHFFGRFYRELADDAGYLAAFRRAQSATRGEFREYRDWGAFYFMGPCSGIAGRQEVSPQIEPGIPRPHR